MTVTDIHPADLADSPHHDWNCASSDDCHKSHDDCSDVSSYKSASPLPKRDSCQKTSQITECEIHIPRSFSLAAYDAEKRSRASHKKSWQGHGSLRLPHLILHEDVNECPKNPRLFELNITNSFRSKNSLYPSQSKTPLEKSFPETEKGFDNPALDFAADSGGSDRFEKSETSTETSSEAGRTEGKLWPQVMAALVLAVAAMIEGYSAGYTSPALASMKAPNSTIPITEQQASWIGSLMPLSALFAGIVGGSLVDRYGRKRIMMSIAIPYIISWVLITFAYNLPMIYIGRSIQGFCVGLTTLTLPIYLSETTQPEVRGTLGLLPTTIGNTGILMCYILGSRIDWKILAALGACLPVPYLVMIFYIPETPRWYISKGRYEDAAKALQWLRGKETDISKEFVEIEASYKESCQEESSLKDLFKMCYLRPLLISLGLMFFQQLSGVNAIIFYTVSIFEKSKGTVDSNLSSIIVGLANFFATLGSNLVIDRVGRKLLLNLSGFFMGLSLAVLGLFFVLQHLDHDVTHIGWMPLATFIVYIIAFSVGYGPIPWLMMGEIFPSKVRGPAASVATAFNWACSFIVTKTFADLTDTMGAHGAFWFFGVFCFIGVVFVVIWVPETKGRSLEEIERELMEQHEKRKKGDVECTKF